MSIQQCSRLFHTKKNYLFLFLLFFLRIIYHPQNLNATEQGELTYYMNIEEFTNSFIEIPSSAVLFPSSTINSKYLGGTAAIYNTDNQKVGACSGSFLCIQNEDGVYTDISNFISITNGLIVTWFTPVKLTNLELDTIINGMITECIVEATTKVGINPFYGQTFNLTVSSDDEKIYFNFSKQLPAPSGLFYKAL